jgi:glutaredoxin
MVDLNNSVEIEIYSRPGCHLCDEAKDVIERLRRRYNFVLRLINIQDDPALEAKYRTEIPVVLINGHKAFKYHVNEAELERKVKRLWKT